MRKDAGRGACVAVDFDQALEADIDAAYHTLMTAPDEITQRVALALMTELIAKRSPRQILAMESAQGLH